VKKKIFSIWSVLLILIVSIAVVVPGCDGTGGTITVKATLCGDDWPAQGTGAVNYTLTPTSGTPITGNNVSASFSVDAGTWTCGNVIGGPPNAFLESITPPSVTVAAGETKTITLNFEENQDAGIEFLTWTIDTEPIEYVEYEVVPCQIIDVHFEQWVKGCEGYNVTVKETSWLKITQTVGPGPVQIFVFNDDCALNKTAEPPAENAEKVSQNTTLEGEIVNPGGEPIPLTLDVPVNLDVETIWKMVKEIDYTKSINWFGISKSPFDPGMKHPCVLFELILPDPGVYTFTLVAEANVALVGDTDVNDGNNKATSTPLILTVNVP